MSIEEQRRAKFEEFMADLGWSVRRMTGKDREFYDDTTTQVAWRAYNAAMDSVVIELPPVPAVPEAPEFALDDSHMDQYHAAIGMRHACAKFIEAAGVKVKP